MVKLTPIWKRLFCSHDYAFIAEGSPTVICSKCDKMTTIGKLRMFD